MALTWDKRLPFLDTEGRKRVVERAMACAGAIAKQIGVPEDAVRNARLLGCGNYGCTLLIEGLPRDRSVIKVTSDNLEANAAQQIVEDYTAPQEAGLVQIHKVFRLGKCAVLPKMRPFVFTPQPRYTAYGVQPSTKMSYRGPGAPYRPLWVIQREELEDAWPRLKALGVRKAEADKALSIIFNFAQDFAEFHTTFGGRRRGWTKLPSAEDLSVAAKVVRGEALVSAIEWLVERDMAWLDMRKVINLGWRDGVGLVIRDIGFTAAERDVLDEVETVDGAVRGQLRRR